MEQRSLIICHAAADQSLAQQLADFLTTNLRVEISFDTELPLTAAVERGISAPFALALFSPHSVPETWKRAEWEPAFMTAPDQLGSHLAFGLLADCKFPEVLRRERFFDFTAGFLEPARLVKQWLMRPFDLPRRVFGYAELRATLADRPGEFHGMDSASTFLTDCGLEFERVCRVDAAGRTVAGILGETGHQLGVALPETALRNRQLLGDHLREHRALLIYDNLPPEHAGLVAFGGLATVITTTGPSPVRSEPDMSTLPGRIAQSLRHGWVVCEYLGPLQRYAEKIEVLDMMAAVARSKDDKMGLYGINHELGFMRDEPGDDGERPILSTAPADARQLDLFHEAPASPSPL